MVDLAGFLVGVGLILTGRTVAGILLLAIIAASELYRLFRSELIVQDYNKAAYRQILQALHSRERGPGLHRTD